MWLFGSQAPGSKSTAEDKGGDPTLDRLVLAGILIFAAKTAITQCQ
jgi:hypothetical protein